MADAVFDPSTVVTVIRVVPRRKGVIKPLIDTFTIDEFAEAQVTDLFPAYVGKTVATIANVCPLRIIYLLILSFTDVT